MARTYKFSGFVFDLDGYSVQGNGTNELLTQRHYDLLLVFVQTPNYVFSKTELMKLVWGHDVGEVTVAGAISRLRTVFGETAIKQKLIRTVRDVGYEFRAQVEGPPLPSVPVDNVNQRLDQLTTVVQVLVDRQRQEQQNGFAMINSLPIAVQADTVFNFAQTAAKKWRTAESDVWLKFFDGQQETLQLAFDYYEHIGSKRELELAESMARYWDIRGLSSVGKIRLGGALSRCRVDDFELKAKALGSYAYLLFNQHDRQARVVAEEGVTCARQVEDDESLCLSLQILANIAETQGKYDQAQSLYTQVLQIAKRANLGPMKAWALRGLGSVAKAQLDFEGARKRFKESLTGREELQDLCSVATAQVHLANVVDDSREARLLIEKSKTASTARGHKWALSYGWRTLGLVEERDGNLKAAETAYENSLDLITSLFDVRGIARTKESLAHLAILSGNNRRGAELYGEADGLRLSISAPLAPDERQIHERLKLDAKKKFFPNYEVGLKAV